MARTSTGTTRQVVGLGFLPEEARHGFLIDIPKGSASSEMVCITEHRGNDLDHLGARTVDRPSPNDPALRVVIDRARWLALAPAFWEETNRRLRANGLPVAKFQKNPAKPVPVHPSLGKELCILCWAVEERWWLYTMTVATTGQAMQKGLGWRKALRAAIADNPFVKGEGLSPKARRELLGHSQLSLAL
jgi:hypothetical protein